MSIVKKMRFTDGPVHIINLPGDCAQYFTELEQKSTLAGKGEIGQVLLFAKDKQALDKYIPGIVTRLVPDAIFWVAYPKKSGAIRSDLTRDTGWEVMEGTGYDPVTQVAIDDNWSALRFRESELIGEKLRDTEMADRKLEGVDYVNRQVTLPKDVAAALEPRKDLLELFNNMSFSHKREYIEEIVTAKKPETRERRISKMIAALEQYKEQKAKKK